MTIQCVFICEVAYHCVMILFLCDINCRWSWSYCSRHWFIFYSRWLCRGRYA